MATWNSDNIILTKLGEQVLSKVQSGVGKLTVSRIVSGAGHVSPAQLYSQTQITDIKQEMSVVKYTTNEQQSVISANLTNTGLEEAYDLYQIGIYVTHPDFTDEVLYLIAQCDSPDHIPLPGDNPVTLSYDLVMAHFGTKEVTINVSEAGHVDVTTFNEFIEKTNTALNRKADLSDIPTTLPANGGNADTVGGKHAYEFSQIVDYGDSPTSTNTVPPSGAITIYRCSNWTNYPDGASDGKGILIVACYEGFGFVGASDMWVRQLYITPHNNYKIWQRVITDTTVGEWTNIADGGNADTVGGKNMAELMALGMNYADRTKISEGDLNNYTNAGRFVVTTSEQASAISNSPFTSSGYYLDVYHRATGYYTQIAMNWRGLVKIRSCMDSTWGKWKNISDDGNADTLDGKHASDFATASHTHDNYVPVNMGLNFSTSIKEYAETYKSGAENIEFTWRGYGATDAPYQNRDWFLHAYKVDNDWIRIVAFDIRNTASYEIAKTNGGWGNWKKLADGGNADTLDSKHASDFSQIISFGDTSTDTKTAIGIQGKTTTYWCSAWTDYPATLQDGRGTIIAVNYKSYGTSVEVDNIWCMQLYICPHDSRIYKRIIIGKAVGSWVSIIDNNIVASSTSSGIVSTGKQHFKGQKLFDDSVWVPNPNIVMGNGAPSADTSRVFAFTSSDDSMNNASAYMQNVARAAGNNELYLALRSLTSKTLILGLGVKITADGSNHYTYVTNPAQSTQVALRNISSGTATATTTNCPSGSWYGKHS